jgi:Fe-S oxidoreductase
MMDVLPLAPFREVIDEIKASGGDAAKRCYECGICDAVCPWNRVSTFSVRKLIREAAFGLSEIEREEIWRCTTCGLCPEQCPRDVKQIEDMVALRRMATEYGLFPPPVRSIRGISSSLASQGNPLGEERSTRADWAAGLPVRPFTEGMEVLYFPGCYLSYDPRLKKVAAATVALLDRAGVEFGILGVEENCCGESIRKTGNEQLFKRLARENIKTFVEHGVKKILVSSPHCYHTFQSEYPEFMVRFEVVHISQYLFQLIREGRLALTREVGKQATYHDPCYLGRHHGIFDEPRQVLNSVPGLVLREMAECREDSLCCGMGGGRIWFETPLAERFSTIRLEQASDVGAEVLVTACPYCLTQFEDTRLSLEDGETIQIKDITEVLRDAIESPENT